MSFRLKVAFGLGIAALPSLTARAEIFPLRTGQVWTFRVSDSRDFVRTQEWHVGGLTEIGCEAGPSLYYRVDMLTVETGEWEGPAYAISDDNNVYVWDEGVCETWSLAEMPCAPDEVPFGSFDNVCCYDEGDWLNCFVAGVGYVKWVQTEPTYTVIGELVSVKNSGAINSSPVRFARYFPLGVGSTWKYENLLDATDTFTLPVLESFNYDGIPAVKFAYDVPWESNYVICSNDCETVTFYDYVSESGGGNLDSFVAMKELKDGDRFPFGQGSILAIRLWDTLDPVAKDGFYNLGNGPFLSTLVPRSLRGLVLWAWYDTDMENPNRFNALLDPGQPIPGAITDLEWFQPGVGRVAMLGVHAENGNMGRPYRLVEYIIDSSSCFVRGEVDGVEGVDISDAIAILGHLFLGVSPEPFCAKAADTDDSGELDLTDAIYLLGHLFSGGTPLPTPYPECGSDPTTDELSCSAIADCVL